MTVGLKMLPVTSVGWETWTRLVSDIPGPVMLLCTVKFESTPVVFTWTIQVREKEVPAFRVELRLRWKIGGERGVGTA